MTSADWVGSPLATPWVKAHASSLTGVHPDATTTAPTAVSLFRTPRRPIGELAGAGCNVPGDVFDGCVME